MEPEFLYPWLGPATEDEPSGADTDTLTLLEPLLRAYVASQAELQVLETRPGDLYSGGLGEPKYMVNGTAFDGNWGRPQR